MLTLEQLQQMVTDAFTAYKAAEANTTQKILDYENLCAQIGSAENSMRQSKDATRDARIYWDFLSTKIANNDLTEFTWPIIPEQPPVDPST